MRAPRSDSVLDERERLRPVARRTVRRRTVRFGEPRPAGRRPPASRSSRTGDDAEDDPAVHLECDVRAPLPSAADELDGAVDRVEQPSSSVDRRCHLARLLRQHAIARTLARQHLQHRCLGGPVGLADRAAVGLGLVVDDVGDERLRGSSGDVGQQQREVDVGRPTPGPSPHPMERRVAEPSPFGTVRRRRARLTEDLPADLAEVPVVHVGGRHQRAHHLEAGWATPSQRRPTVRCRLGAGEAAGLLGDDVALDLARAGVDRQSRARSAGRARCDRRRGPWGRGGCAGRRARPAR